MVNFGATQNVYGSAIETTLSSGGTLTVALGGIASGTVVLSGGTAVAESDGTASGTMVGGGGTQVVQNNGTVVGATVGSGGTELVSGGGTDIGTSIDSGGSEIIFAQGLATSTTISGSGVEVVSAGGTAADIFIASGGTAEIANGATVSGAITLVTSGGTLELGGATPALGAGTISGLAPGDTVDLTDVAFVSGATASVTDGSLNVTIIESAMLWGLACRTPCLLPSSRCRATADRHRRHLQHPQRHPVRQRFLAQPCFRRGSQRRKTVTLTLDMNEQHLTVSGTPGLTLNDGGVATYVASASKPTSGVLVFRYTVSAGQNSADLQVTGSPVVDGR